MFGRYVAPRRRVDSPGRLTRKNIHQRSIEQSGRIPGSLDHLARWLARYVSADNVLVTGDGYDALFVEDIVPILLMLMVRTVTKWSGPTDRESLVRMFVPSYMKRYSRPVDLLEYAVNTMDVLDVGEMDLKTGTMVIDTRFLDTYEKKAAVPTIGGHW